MPYSCYDTSPTIIHDFCHYTHLWQLLTVLPIAHISSDQTWHGSIAVAVLLCCAAAVPCAAAYTTLLKLDITPQHHCSTQPRWPYCWVMASALDYAQNGNHNQYTCTCFGRTVGVTGARQGSVLCACPAHSDEHLFDYPAYSHICQPFPSSFIFSSSFSGD